MTLPASGNPTLSILSDEFLEEIQGMKRKNLALELLKKILNDELRTRTRKNLAQGRKFSEMLEQAIRKYQNNLLTAAQVIEELINLAKEMKVSDERAADMGLSGDEVRVLRRAGAERERKRSNGR